MTSRCPCGNVAAIGGKCTGCYYGTPCAECGKKSVNLRDCGRCARCVRLTAVICSHESPVLFLGHCVQCVADNTHSLRSFDADAKMGICVVCGNTAIRFMGKNGKAEATCRRAQNFNVKANRYGGSRSAMRDLYLKSGGACYICGVPEGERSLHVDHDHACCKTNPTCGGCTRALLCDLHNRVAGFLEHPDRDIVETYLKEFRKED